MPILDNSKLSLGNQSQKDKDINDKRLASMGRVNKLVIKKKLQTNILIDVYENSSQDNLCVYLVHIEHGNRKVAGLIDIINQSYPYLSVQMSFVDANFQRNGYGSLMYRTALGYLGGITCDSKLTTASFRMWQSLGKDFYSYLVDADNKMTEVGNFDDTMLGSEEVRFVVTEEEYEENNY